MATAGTATFLVPGIALARPAGPESASPRSPDKFEIERTLVKDGDPIFRLKLVHNLGLNHPQEGEMHIAFEPGVIYTPRLEQIIQLSLPAYEQTLLFDDPDQGVLGFGVSMIHLEGESRPWRSRVPGADLEQPNTLSTYWNNWQFNAVKWNEQLLPNLANRSLFTLP